MEKVKHKLTILWLFCFLSIANAQPIHQSKIDELQQLLQKEMSNDKKLDLLLEQAQLYHDQMDFDQQSKTLELALATAKVINEPSKIIQVYLKLGAPRWEDAATQKRRKEAINLAEQLVQNLDHPDLVTQVLDCKTALLEKEKEEESFNSYLSTLALKKSAELSELAIAQSYFNLGKTGTLLQKRDTSLQYFHDALKILKPIDQQKEALTLIGHTYYEIAFHYNFLKYEKEKVEVYVDSALTVFTTLKSLPFENQTRILLAEYLTNYDQYPQALEELNQVITNSNKYVSGETFGMMGLLSYYNKNYNESLDYYKKSLHRYQIGNNKYEAAVAEAAIAFVYGKIKDFDNALPYLDSAEAYAEKSQNLQLQSSVYYAKAKVLDDLGQNEASIKVRKKVIGINQELKKEGDAAEQMLSLATSYIKTNQLDSAQYFNDIGYNYFNPINEVGPLSLVHKNYYELYKKKKDYKKALENLELKNAYRDSIQRNVLEKKLNQERVNLKVVEAKESVNEAEKQTAQAEREANLLASRNQLYLALAASLVLLLLAGSYFFFQLKNSKQKIESQNTQLQQLNTTKDKFFGIIAHDIRSPIVALDGVGEQMDYYLKNNKKEKLQLLSGRIDSTAKRLGSLLDNLLNWALLQQGVIPYHPKELNVQETAKNIFQMFQNNADAKNIRLNLQIDNNIKVHADESALNTILRNLISNAIKFTPEGGTVSLSTETKGDKVFINVNDTGTGISAEKLSTLFSLEKKSEQGTAGERGTGLGLTLVKELAELNKGSVIVNSVLEKGSSFKIGLPMIT